jgi:hypothetical protein
LIGHSLSPGAHFLLWGIPLLLVLISVTAYLAGGRRGKP